MRKLFINGYDIDLVGNEKIATTYQASPVADLPAAQGFFSVEFSLPKTQNNRKAFGIPDSLPNNSAIPFSLLDAQYQVDGVDMKINSAQLVSVGDTLKVRLYGGFTSLIQLMGNLTLQELDLSTLDHARTLANIQAALQGTEGYIYPLIDYLDDIGANYINIESMYPSVFLHTVVDQIMTDAGYTLAGDLVGDSEYESVILPFSNKAGEYSTAFIDALKSKMYLVANLSYDAEVGINNLLFTGEINDQFNLIYDSQYHALINATYELNLRLEIFGIPTSNVTITVFKKKESIPATYDPLTGYTSWDTFDVVDSFNLTGTDFGTGLATLDEVFTVNMRKGDSVFVVFQQTAASSPITIDAGELNSFLEVTDVTNYGIFIDDLWQVAPNLPKIKQSDLLKWVINAFSCIAYVDNEAKTLTLTKFSNVVKNIQRYNWSEKLDKSKPISIGYPANLAQLNHFRYLLDENFYHPDGADFSFTMDNNNLEPEKDFYVAPFGATIPVTHFTANIDIPRIDILSNQLKPRVLVNNSITAGTAVALYKAGISQGTQINVCAPYFIDPNFDFNLGWGVTLLPRYGEKRLQTIQRQRILTASFKLTPADINQLDFSKPVWIDDYNTLFYLIRVNQFEAGSSTVCELLEIP